MLRKLPIFAVVVVTLSTGAVAAAKSDDRVWVSRPDGSLQCDDKAEAAAHDRVAEAKEVLRRKGVQVLEAKKRNDGKLRAQSCGISTGNETTFLIPKKDLAKAKTLGFDAVAN